VEPVILYPWRSIHAASLSQSMRFQLPPGAWFTMSPPATMSAWLRALRASRASALFLSEICTSACFFLH